MLPDHVNAAADVSHLDKHHPRQAPGRRCRAETSIQESHKEPASFSFADSSICPSPHQIFVSQTKNLS